MNNDLYHCLLGSSLSIRDSGLVMADIEPNSCLIDFTSKFGPFDPCTNDPVEQLQRFKAKAYIDLLTAELTNQDNNLVIKYLVVISNSQKIRIGEAIVSDQQVDEVDFQTMAELNRLKKSDSAKYLNMRNEQYIFIKNPDDWLKASLVAGRLIAQQNTSVTPLCIAEWAASKGIESNFSRLLKPIPSKENSFSNATIEDAPALIDALICADIPYMSNQLKAALAALKRIVEKGTGKYTLTVAIRNFIQSCNFKLSDGEQSLIPKILNFTGTRTSSLPPLIKSSSNPK